MKIRSISLKNYKKFVPITTFSFLDSEGLVNPKTLITGNNGSGKTTILQAIVSLIAPLVRENVTPDSLDWPGYEYRHLHTGPLPLKIEVEIEFSASEISATIDYAQQLINQDIKLVLPGNSRTVKLSLDYENIKVKPMNQPVKTLFQFSGYQYAKRLATITPNKNILFESVGNIYWYTENRSSTSITNLFEDEHPQIDYIRSFLASAHNYHLAITDGKRQMKEGEFDFYEKLHTLYKIVFPGRSFIGSTPRFDIYEKASVPDFYLYDGRNQYELSGMSAGERAVFPILMDFARWNINNSIVIIDELELHLHPPLQQAFIKALNKLGNNNQFIITSHSDTVANMFDENENQIIRLTND